MYYDATLERSTSFSIYKVFGWLFMAMGITAVTACGFALLLMSGFISGEAYAVIMIASVLLMFVETFVMQYRVIRNNKSLIFPFIVYSITMGVMLSTFVILVNPLFIALAFGITATLFGVMALYGYLVKRDLNIMGSLAFSLIIGAFIISMVNIFIASDTIDWIVSFVSFGAIMLFVSVDMWRIKKIAESGIGTSNLCLYCAFQLYIDFIYIFMRVISFFSRVSNNK
ncbi:MAG: Bax inhibitor-1 family protein [Erysipelotrichales bacterium]|nr:Bax inhibitor-1 family protein [Erysipelotrichales bacterium]